MRAIGEIINPSRTPRIANNTPASAPTTQKSSFIPISQIKPSNENSQISIGKFMLFDANETITSLTQESSKKREDAKLNAKIEEIIAVKTVASSIAVSVKIIVAVKTIPPVIREYQSSVKGAFILLFLTFFDLNAAICLYIVDSNHIFKRVVFIK